MLPIITNSRVHAHTYTHNRKTIPNKAVKTRTPKIIIFFRNRSRWGVGSVSSLAGSRTSWIQFDFELNSFELGPINITSRDINQEILLFTLLAQRDSSSPKASASHWLQIKSSHFGLCTSLMSSWIRENHLVWWPDANWKQRNNTENACQQGSTKIKDNVAY